MIDFHPRGRKAVMKAWPCPSLSDRWTNHPLLREGFLLAQRRARLCRASVTTGANSEGAVNANGDEGAFLFDLLGKRESALRRLVAN